MEKIAVAITSVKFESESGDCPPELEKDLQDLTRTIEYHAKKVAEKHGLAFEIEEN